MGKRYQTVTENTKPSQRSPNCFYSLGVKFCLICTHAPVADWSERRMCSQVWKGMALLISGELPRVFCERHLVLTRLIGMRAWGRGLCSGDSVLLCSLQNLTLSYFHSSFPVSATPLVKWWDWCWLLQGEHPEGEIWGGGLHYTGQTCSGVRLIYQARLLRYFPEDCEGTHPEVTFPCDMQSWPSHFTSECSNTRAHTIADQDSWLNKV